MSEPEGYEAVTVTDHGITVTKRFEEDEFPVPAIAFEFEAERDETVRVTLTDQVPDGVEVEDLGFHPEYGSEFWTIDEEAVTFEREIEANGEYTTVYGIRATGTDDIERFLSPPELATVDPPLTADDETVDAAADVVPGDSEDVVREVISGEDDVPPGLENESESEEDVQPLDLDDPQNGTASGPSSVSTDAAPPTHDSDTGTADDRSLVAAIADDLRSNDVAPKDVKLLREALEIAGQEGGSIAARVDRIQRDVSDLRAYTDALGDFLDQNGTAETLIEDFRSGLEDLEATVADVESTIGRQGSTLESVEAELDAVETTVSDLESTVGSLESDLETVEQQVGDEDIAERLDDIEADLEDMQSWQTQIKNTFGGE